MSFERHYSRLETRVQYAMLGSVHPISAPKDRAHLGSPARRSGLLVHRHRGWPLTLQVRARSTALRKRRGGRGGR